MAKFSVVFQGSIGPTHPLVEAARRVMAETGDRETVIRFLREETQSPAASYIILTLALEIPPPAAKEAVLLSPTWAEIRGATQRLHRVIKEAIDADSSGNEP